MSDPIPRSLKKSMSRKGSSRTARRSAAQGKIVRGSAAQGSTRKVQGRSTQRRKTKRRGKILYSYNDAGENIESPSNALPIKSLSEVNITFLSKEIDKKTKEEYIKYNESDKIFKKHNNLTFNEIIENIECLKRDIKDKDIIPSLWSRFGDLDKSLYINERDINEILMKYYNIYVGIIMSKLKFLETIYPNSIPTAKDALLIDSKLDYMRILLENGLCDPNSIICYTHDGKLNNTIKFLDTISQENCITYLGNKQDKDKFHIKISFSGSSKCTLPINTETLFNDVDNISNINQVFTNIEKIFVGEDEIDPDFLNFRCLGHKYGFIIQPENKNFETIDNENNFGEIRCFCYQGEIKSIAIDQRENNRHILTPPFQVIAVHNSYFLEEINKLEDASKKSFYFQNAKKYLQGENGYLFGNVGIYKKQALSDTFKTTILSDLIDKCAKTYRVLKQNLDLDGVHHRIDLIYCDAVDGYVVNEVENINYGENADLSLYLFDCIDAKYKKLITKVKSDKEKLKFFSVGNICDLTEEGYVFLNRQILLTFNED